MECAVGGAAAHGEANRAHERGLVLADRLGVEIGRGRVELARLEGAKLAREDVVEDVVHVHLRKGAGGGGGGRGRVWVDLGRTKGPICDSPDAATLLGTSGPICDSPDAATLLVAASLREVRGRPRHVHTLT